MSYIFRGFSLPDHLKESLDQYIMVGRPTGGFLEACISNDFVGAVARADDESLKALPAIAGYLYNELPIGSWGNSMRYDLWIKIKNKHQERYNK